ncbi:MAG: hypothetical protein CM15mP74_18580 [Halieaceae bacterium]|nr:MAG: hypothetical protein CM15mP74_18580 [Halieaceae bacterium]
MIATRGAPLSLDLAQPLGVALALLSTVLWSLYWIINTRLSWTRRSICFSTSPAPYRFAHSALVQ